MILTLNDTLLHTCNLIQAQRSSLIYMYIRDVQGGSSENPSCHQKFGKIPLSGEAGPPYQSPNEARRQIFMVFKGIFLVFREISGIFRI